MPYGPHTSADRQRMLTALGIEGVDELFARLFADVPHFGNAVIVDRGLLDEPFNIAGRLCAKLLRHDDHGRYQCEHK